MINAHLQWNQGAVTELKYLNLQHLPFYKLQLSSTPSFPPWPNVGGTFLQQSLSVCLFACWSCDTIPKGTSWSSLFSFIFLIFLVQAQIKIIYLWVQSKLCNIRIRYVSTVKQNYIQTCFGHWILSVLGFVFVTILLLSRRAEWSSRLVWASPLF